MTREHQDSCRETARLLAIFKDFKCFLSMQVWYRWIALVVLVILNQVSCLYDTYSGRYERFSL